MRSSTKALNPTSAISDLDDRELEEAIRLLLDPATEQFRKEMDSMGADLIKELSSSGSLSDAALNKFLDHLMLSVADLYDAFQKVLTGIGMPMSEQDVEWRKQALINDMIDLTNEMIERVHEDCLIMNE